jgi:hypothetical protein
VQPLSAASIAPKDFAIPSMTSGQRAVSSAQE